MYILVFAFWLLLCGKITLETILIGLFITIVLALVIYKLFDYSYKQELLFLKKLPVICIYGFVLLWEILKANLLVARFILFRKYKISPTLITFHADVRTNIGCFLLANSITLTPGTITVKNEGNLFTVHCLDASMLDTSENSVFQRWIRRMES